jgi:hypothetical protein
VYCEGGTEFFNTVLILYISGFKEKEKRIRTTILISEQVKHLRHTTRTQTQKSHFVYFFLGVSPLINNYSNYSKYTVIKHNSK